MRIPSCRSTTPAIVAAAMSLSITVGAAKGPLDPDGALLSIGTVARVDGANGIGAMAASGAVAPPLFDPQPLPPAKPRWSDVPDVGFAVPVDDVVENPAEATGSPDQVGAEQSAVAGDANRPEGSVPRFDAPRRSDPPAKKELLAGERALKLRDYRRAAAAASRSIELHPENPRAYNLRALANIFLKDYKAAIDDARAANRLFPHNASGLRSLAFAELRHGNMREAVEVVTRSIHVNPANPLSYAIRAYAADALGNRAAAAFWMGRAAELEPAFADRLKRARAGGSIYDPTESDEDLLRPESSPAHAPQPRSPFSTPIGAALLAGAAALVWHRRTEISHVLKRLRGARISALFSATSRRIAGRYELGRVIGRGGMGVVHESMDHRLQRVVAIKKMTENLSSLDERWRTLYVNEAKTVASLHHPAIVQIHDTIEENDELYLVFELVTGETVQRLLARRGCLSIEETLDILRPVSEALEFAHSMNLVHRDLKPSNIMITETGGVKLMDFGLARSVASSGALDYTQTAYGTPCYMAPESEQGTVCREGDVYALGVCVYEMLTGAPPFPPKPPALAKEQMNFPPATFRRQDLPKEIDDLMVRVLQPDPKRRLRRPREIVAQLETALKAGTPTPV
ncbi:MAG: protein kinase [Elusimicrobia bacterium]|nr:protein kinase [Elusimicrobiota bacterium]